jgi:hypothetical protein
MWALSNGCDNTHLAFLHAWASCIARESRCEHRATGDGVRSSIWTPPPSQMLQLGTAQEAARYALVYLPISIGC